MTTAREVAEPNVILRCEVGSHAHGLSLGPSSDRDEMAVCIEPPEFVVGNGRVMDSDGVMRDFGQWVHRTAEERARHDAAADQRRHGRTPRSAAGDLDLTVYSLRKWCRLAAQGNPTVLLLLFAKPLEIRAAGMLMRANADMFASREAGARFLGYLKAQRERLLGERGQMRVTRTELVEAHGYDVKFATHAIRLGLQGIEYLTTGRLELPMAEPARSLCLSVRRGEWGLPKVIGAIEAAEADLLRLLDTSPLPERPDRERIDAFLVDAYTTWWARPR